MATYIVRRLLHALIVIWIVSIIVFWGMRLLPGDPVLMFLTRGQLGSATLEQVEHIRETMGLNRPMVVQYLEWLLGLFKGDFGISISQRSDVFEIIKQRIPVTIHLTLLAFFACNMIGIPAGIIASVRRGEWLDTFVTSTANIGITVPTFWLGIILIYFFSFRLGLIPIFGYVSPMEDFWESTRSVIAPVICLALPHISTIARMSRSSMLEVIHQDYIRTARSKGLEERRIVLGHALKNALIPIVTLQGMSISQIIGGSVIIECVFGIPGVGRLAQQAMLAQDYPVVQAIVLLTAILILTINIIIDISYGWINPRVRYK